MPKLLFVCLLSMLATSPTFAEDGEVTCRVSIENALTIVSCPSPVDVTMAVNAATAYWQAMTQDDAPIVTAIAAPPGTDKLSTSWGITFASPHSAEPQ